MHKKERCRLLMKKISMILSIGLLAIFLVACGNNDTNEAGGKIFKFGAQTYTDPKLMGQIVKQLIEDQTIHEVEITEDIQATPQVIGALEKEEFDFALMFSGEVYNNYFDDDEIEFTTDAEATMQQAQDLFKKHYGFIWYDTAGFANQYGIAVKEEFAEEHNLSTMSDLAPIAGDMKMGADSTWREREIDGYGPYREAYGYEFNDVLGMDTSLMYEGISGGDIDVITAYTVDPHVNENNLVLLEDDLQFFPPYEGSIVAREDIVEEYPEVAEILDSIVGIISTEEMTELIGEVDLDGRSTAEVAKEFLQEKGLLD